MIKLQTELTLLKEGTPQVLIDRTLHLLSWFDLERFRENGVAYNTHLRRVLLFASHDEGSKYIRFELTLDENDEVKISGELRKCDTKYLMGYWCVYSNYVRLKFRDQDYPEYYRWEEECILA